MKINTLKVLVSVLSCALSTVSASAAPRVTGVLGTPGATTTISGKQLPPPPPKFGGEIELVK